MTNLAIDVKGKVVLVTGSNRGIGRAIVIELLERGATKVYAGARNVSNLNDLALQYSSKLVPIKLDVTNADDIKNVALVAADIEILINNAGVTVFGSLLTEGATQRLQENLAVNVFGILNLTLALVENLKTKTSAAIVNIGSIAGLGNMPVIGTYAATKAAVHSITQGFRGELRGTNILVVGVYPGPIDTEMSKDFNAPKDTTINVAKAIVDGLAIGKEDIFPDMTSIEVEKTYLTNPKAVEREFAAFI